MKLFVSGIPLQWKQAIHAADCTIFQVLRAFLLLTKCFALVLCILPSCFGSLTGKTIVLFYVSQYLSTVETVSSHILGLLIYYLLIRVFQKKKVGFFRVTQTRKLGQTLLEVCFSPRPLPLPSSFPSLAFSLTFSPLSFFPHVTNFLYQSSSSKNKIQFSFIDLKLEVQNLGCVICSWYTHR